MPIPYPPLAAANYFISLAGPVGVEHMKLQKLVYFAHGWWLTAHEQPFLDERPQIWKHGPVFNSMYHALKPFGRASIISPQSASPFVPPPRIDENDNNVIPLLFWVWHRYGHLSSFALSDMTHRPGTAWSRVAAERNYTVPRGLEIPDSYIREEFVNMTAVDNAECNELSGGNNDRGNSAA